MGTVIMLELQLPQYLIYKGCYDVLLKKFLDDFSSNVDMYSYVMYLTNNNESAAKQILDTLNKELDNPLCQADPFVYFIEKIEALG